MAFGDEAGAANGGRTKGKKAYFLFAGEPGGGFCLYEIIDHAAVNAFSRWGYDHAAKIQRPGWF